MWGWDEFKEDVSIVLVIKGGMKRPVEHSHAVASASATPSGNILSVVIRGRDAIVESDAWQWKGLEV